MAYLSNKPILILKENTEEVKGKSALKMNIQAVQAVAEAIKTTLGPRSLNKMIVDSLGDVVVTNDGAKILEELAIENPAAKMIVDLSKTIRKDVGDGTSSVVIFVGELMGQVEDLLSMEIHPSIIYDGYAKALDEIKKYLDQIALKVDLNDEKTIKQIIKTALESKNLYNATDVFVDIIYNTIQSICDQYSDGCFNIDLDNVQIIKKEGESLENSSLIRGLIIDKEVVNPMMPKLVKNAKIALIDGTLEVVKTEFSSEIEISTPEEVQAFIEQEQNMLKEMVDAIKNAGANVVFCQKGIDETAQHFLAKYGIMAIRRVKLSDMKKLAQATGAKIVTRIKSIQSSDLGSAEVVSQNKIGKDYMIFVEGCKDPRAVTVLIRGGNEEIVDDGERALKNGLNVLKTLYEMPYYVGGGGSIEIELSKHLREIAAKAGGKQQIAIEHYADALEVIPRVLVNNSGSDPLDIITDLHAKVDYKKKQYFGYDVKTTKIVDVKKEGILDPVKVKLHIYTLATELANIFIRVDDYIKKGSS